MKVKELIIELLGKDMSEEVFVDTGNGLKKVRCVCSMESDTDNPRYYQEILLEK